MWQVKNSENVIDYEFIGEYYVKISCECGYQWAAIRRNGVMKRVLRVIKGHACDNEREKKVICARCCTPVSFNEVSPGYYAVCEYHDEDLYQFETIERG